MTHAATTLTCSGGVGLGVSRMGGVNTYPMGRMITWDPTNTYY